MECSGERRNCSIACCVIQPSWDHDSYSMTNTFLLVLGFKMLSLKVVSCFITWQTGTGVYMYSPKETQPADVL